MCKATWSGTPNPKLSATNLVQVKLWLLKYQLNKSEPVDFIRTTQIFWWYSVNQCVCTFIVTSYFFHLIINNSNMIDIRSKINFSPLIIFGLSLIILFRKELLACEHLRKNIGHWMKRQKWKSNKWN